ncbi:MAG: hypothetical protein IKF91_01840, partial [Bacilli bacterium]|nr:hypothetical protein [Bacilli bacterium]
ASSEAPDQGLISAAGVYKTEAEVPTYSDRVTAFGKNYYLKHDVVEDVITASYVCFVYNNAEHCMKGGDVGASFAANTQMIQEYQTFYNLGAYDSNTFTGCYFNSSDSICRGGGFGNVESYSYGYVYVFGSSGNCAVYNVGTSYCEE